MEERIYTVEQLFEVLEGYKITSNIESVRRWLRNGTIEGIAPTSRKVGWKVTQSALDAFLKERLPEKAITTNITKEDNTTDVALSGEVAKLKEQLSIAQSKLHQSREREIQTIDRDAIRAQMWREITSKNIWEGYVSIKRSMLKAAAEHRYYTPELIEKVWERLTTDSSNRGYKQPRVSYLLDAFSFDGERVLMDNSFASLEEQVVYALIEHVKKELYQAQRKTMILQISE
ncbi:hypothetical protein QN089_15875 (plasmid) [Kurthia sp. YJT4]|uniref:hypothetical protein n=1 Tax=unclassified Kurthia TaxID=2644826 RepID=UPI00254BD903|nr:hypothetical protein [Kurthia sp. YJT4]WIL40215.1 hypothetical protein QN089_15875 [Kurthia sp. YJT4]